MVLERIFLSAKEVEKDESSSGAKDEETSSNSIKNEELQSEITKQKILVAYLKVRLFIKSVGTVGKYWLGNEIAVALVLSPVCQSASQWSACMYSALL